MPKPYMHLALCLLAIGAIGCGSEDSGRDQDGGTGGVVGSGGADPGLGGSGAGTGVGGGGADTGVGGSGGDTAAGGTGAGGSSTGGSEPGTGGGTASTGCGRAAPSAAPSSIEVGGQARTFILDVPANYDPNVPAPVIFGFHGAGTSGELYRSAFYGNLLSTFGAEYIVVHPDALAGDGDRTAWDSQGGTDVDFFDALLAVLVSTYCVDESRVFAAGHSSGGFFTNVLACQRGDVLRGIGPISGGGPFTFGGSTCNGQVAAWIAHGIDDPTVALSSGESSRDHWAEANHCDTTQTTTPAPTYPCVEYVGCDSGYAVRWCAYEGDHNPPDFGPQGLYDFFSAL